MIELYSMDNSLFIKSNKTWYDGYTQVKIENGRFNEQKRQSTLGSSWDIGLEYKL